VVESCHEDGSGDDEEEGDGSKDAVGDDERLVSNHLTKSVAHAWKVSNAPQIQDPECVPL
jgi:hypothetical protein